ncbi:Sensitivity to red light reduced [Thalictrum thalictroides]|uniref:Sensitivity to red light reduced n=1 Tax=Thalictrum thalictroides TaxID=46969 RepID=A0A7J6W1I3_THATH|nr:Sensitivity to red light reduced [Thalictrum thalictroides]
MSATTKTLKPHTQTAVLSGDWTIVTPRRAKLKRKSILKVENLEQHSWTPSDVEIDADREAKLMKKMEICIRNLENSEFYRNVLVQIQTPQVLHYFSRNLASETKMQMVIYGIGSVESYETPRLQLSLAILIKKNFNWIGDIEVFDPVLSKTEIKVLEAWGCSVLMVNEQGRRQVLKPTLFFMPHCEAVLYDNLLQANWRAEHLNQVVLFGNSFDKYEQHMSEFKNSAIVDSAKFILGVRKFTVEVAIDIISEDFFRAFHDSSWHFFNLDPQMDVDIHSLKLSSSEQ